MKIVHARGEEWRELEWLDEEHEINQWSRVFGKWQKRHVCLRCHSGIHNLKLHLWSPNRIFTHSLSLSRSLSRIELLSFSESYDVLPKGNVECAIVSGKDWKVIAASLHKHIIRSLAGYIYERQSNFTNLVQCHQCNMKCMCALCTFS